MNSVSFPFDDGTGNVTSAESCAKPPITKYPAYLKRSASFMTSLRRMPIFDGHNDVLLRLYRRGGTNIARAFLEGGDNGQLDLPMARQGGFAGGLFAIFVPASDGATGPNDERPARNVDRDSLVAPAVELTVAQQSVANFDRSVAR